MTVGELGHLKPPCREAALLTDAERIHWLRQERWIQYPRAERILERLMDLVDYPPRDRMPCLVIYGATGMGKTRIIQKFLRDNRTHFDKQLGRTRLPVVSIQMPPSPSERDLYEELLAAMGGIFAHGTSVTTLRHRIRALARQLEVRLLVIDETIPFSPAPIANRGYCSIRSASSPTIFGCLWSVRERTKRNRRS